MGDIIREDGIGKDRKFGEGEMGRLNEGSGGIGRGWELGGGGNWRLGIEQLGGAVWNWAICYSYTRKYRI